MFDSSAESERNEVWHALDLLMQTRLLMLDGSRLGPCAPADLAADAAPLPCQTAFGRAVSSAQQGASRPALAVDDPDEVMALGGDDEDDEEEGSLSHPTGDRSDRELGKAARRGRVRFLVYDTT